MSAEMFQPPAAIAAKAHADAATGDLNRQCAEILKFIAEKL